MQAQVAQYVDLLKGRKPLQRRPPGLKALSSDVGAFPRV